MHHGRNQWAYDAAARIVSNYGFPPEVARDLELRIVTELLRASADAFQESRDALLKVFHGADPS
jgi:hypothetical protein